MPSQGHYFSSYIKTTRFYNLLISGYIKSSGVFANLRFRKISLFGIPSFVLGISRTINVRKIRIIVSNSLVKFTMPIIKTIIFPKTRVLSVLRLRTQYFVTLVFKKFALSGVATLKWNFSQSLIKFPKFVFYASPEAATFYKLLTYDPQQLNAMDSKTLAELDKAVS